MAFEGLTEKLNATFKKLRGKGRLSENDVREAMREVRLALLEAKGLSAAASSVTVSTIHASKGLEFPYVFIVGCSEGLIPYGASIAGEALEEERRLLYVGVTRAEDGLHMSYARAKDEGSRPNRFPSRFLS